ncbi:hypothetical protein, partial [Geotalea toluenoxydans]|uniref:hypothetical protein n=1 Tax=Geotalea toluenoxydans TaxID=421624 RepID=UPI001FB5022B
DARPHAAGSCHTYCFDIFEFHCLFSLYSWLKTKTFSPRMTRIFTNNEAKRLSRPPLAKGD